MLVMALQQFTGINALFYFPMANFLKIDGNANANADAIASVVVAVTQVVLFY